MRPIGESRALWTIGPADSVLRTEPLPALQPGWCEVRALCSSISPGTERLVVMGQVPEALRDEMRCPYMQGDFGFPIKYGYSLVAEVVAGPDELVGQRVHVLHPHQDRCVVQVADVFPVPAGVPAARATLASNLETAVNALWDARVGLGERALVVGFGIVGSLVARLLAGVPGVQVQVVDTAPEKLRLARSLGFEACSPEEVSGPCDVAFHASASPAGLQLAVDTVGLEGRIIELSWYGTRAVSVQLGGSFHSQRKQIISSQVSRIPPMQAPRWDYRRRKQLVFELLADPAFDAHLTHEVPFESLSSVFVRMADAPLEGLAHLVDYRIGEPPKPCSA